MHPDPSHAPAPNDHLLEDLAQLTGLFNPEIIWHQEELLDQLDEAAAPENPAPDAPTEADQR